MQEFTELGIKSPEQLKAHVNNVIQNGEYKPLGRGRAAFYDESTNTIVIYDPNHKDKGTVFRPVDGRDYFDNQIN